MNKTLGFWFEKILSYGMGILTFYICNNYWQKLIFLKDTDFLDKIISITSTLFGFLLAVLTLLLQSSSVTIEKMKKHGSFLKLIYLNKLIVLTSIINCILSFFLFFSMKLICEKSEKILKILTSLNFSLLSFVLINTLLFTILFYQIIISDEKKTSS